MLAPAAGAVVRHAPKHMAAAVVKPAPAQTPLQALQAAAQRGDAQAQTQLGDDYLLGRDGLAKDVGQARAWYEKAAAQNQPDAAFVLGEIYWNGDGIAKDDGEAARWWQVAYAHGRTDAAKLLGDEAFDRARGAGDTWNLPALEEALGWYQKAADAAGPELQAEAQDRVRVVQHLIDADRARGS